MKTKHKNDEKSFQKKRSELIKFKQCSVLFTLICVILPLSLSLFSIINLLVKEYYFNELLLYSLVGLSFSLALGTYGIHHHLKSPINNFLSKDKEDKTYNFYYNLHYNNLKKHIYTIFLCGIGLIIFQTIILTFLPF